MILHFFLLLTLLCHDVSGYTTGSATCDANYDGYSVAGVSMIGRTWENSTDGGYTITTSNPTDAFVADVPFTITLTGTSVPFTGFLINVIDIWTNNRIGHFIQSSFAGQPVGPVQFSTCYQNVDLSWNSVTHSDATPKTVINLDFVAGPVTARARVEVLFYNTNTRSFYPITLLLDREVPPYDVGQATMIIDDFGDPLSWVQSPGVLAQSSSLTVLSRAEQFQRGEPHHILGTEREIVVEAIKKTLNATDGTAKSVVQNSLVASSDSNIAANWTFTWDGQDGSFIVDPDGLGGVDLLGMTNCGGFGNPSLFISIVSQDHCHTLSLTMWQYQSANVGTYNGATPSIQFGNTCHALEAIMRIPLDEYQLEGVDVTAIGAIQLQVDAIAQDVPALDFVYDLIRFGCCSVSSECDDGDPCTTDLCIENTCVQTPIDCDDNDLCSDDYCSGGLCYNVPYDPLSYCFDDNACTEDTCDAIQGCVNTDISDSCVDPDMCTVASCNPNALVFPGCEYSNRFCFDLDLCTDDECNPLTGCHHPRIDGSDSDVCTDDTCDPQTGNWTYTDISSDCDDSNECTEDTCDPVDGCIFTDISARCDDSDVCTDDSCDPVDYCEHVRQDPSNWDDNNECTNDYCDAATGYHNDDTSADCDDLNPCTDDLCDPVIGCDVTVFDPDIRFNDDNDCTTEFCDPALGDPVTGEYHIHDCAPTCVPMNITIDPYYIGDPTTPFTAVFDVGSPDPDAILTITAVVSPPEVSSYTFTPDVPLANQVGTPSSPVQVQFDYGCSVLVEQIVTVDVTVTDQFGANVGPGDGCTVSMTCLEAPACPDTCEERFKRSMCYPDVDGHLNLICVHLDDISDYLFNGGFYPGLENSGYDCTCQPIVPTMTSEPTADPTAEPTAEPTADPTAEPTAEPSAEPSAPPTAQPTALGSIGDFVWMDLDEDGVQDGGAEDGIPNVTLDLIEDTNGNGVADPGEPVISTTTTDWAGRYLFPDLTPQSYIVNVTDTNNALSGWYETFPDGASNGFDGQQHHDLTSGEEYRDADFGYNRVPPPPPEVCMDDVPDLPGANFRCVMDSRYNVDMMIVNFSDPDQLESLDTYFPLGSYYDQFGDLSPDIWWNCWCHAECPTDHYMIPVLLEEYTYFYDDTLVMYVAVPDKFYTSELFFQDSDGGKINVAHCVDSTNIGENNGDCEYWETSTRENTTENFFWHNCYNLYVVRLPLSELTPFYEAHDHGTALSMDGWYITYFGNLVSVSLQDLGFDLRNTQKLFTYRHNFRWSITFPIQIPVHTEDVRVYDDVQKLDEVIGAAVFANEFGWGFGSSMSDIWGELRIHTSVQWPFKLDLMHFEAREFTDQIGVSWWEPVDDTDCGDPGIVEYGDENWIVSTSENLVQNGLNVPLPCEQIWLLRIEPCPLGDDCGICTFDDYYDLIFSVHCQDSYADNCPLDERYDNGLDCTFWLTTENFCDLYEHTVTVSAEMDSYWCPERSCDCEENNFIQTFVDHDGATQQEWIYYEVAVTSDEPLVATKLADVEVETVCQDNSLPMEVIFDWVSGWSPEVQGVVDDFPAQNDVDGQCLGDTTEDTVNFAFELDPDFFAIPFDDSCELRVWVHIDLFYAGVTRPDGREVVLLEDELSQNPEDQIRDYKKPSTISTNSNQHKTNNNIKDPIELQESAEGQNAALGESRYITIRDTLHLSQQIDPISRQHVETNNDETIDNSGATGVATGDNNNPQSASGFKCVPLYFLAIFSLAMLLIIF